jgi:hypothetical protein
VQLLVAPVHFGEQRIDQREDVLGRRVRLEVLAEPVVVKRLDLYR